MNSNFDNPLAVIAIVALVGMGWKAERLESQIKALKSEHKEQITATTIAGKERLIKAQQRAEELAHSLRQTEAELSQIKERKTHVIYQAATNRTCFNADLVRVLNDTSSTGSAIARMSNPVEGTDADSATIATDTDVALWVEHAKEQHEICRARHQALIDFFPKKRDLQ